MKLFPTFLRLEGRRVLVVGAGAVAERKIADLCDAGAIVTVVAPHATPVVQQQATSGALTWHARGYEDDDVQGAWFVVAATNDPAVQQRVAEACEQRQVFLLAVDDVANTSATGGSVIRRPPFLVAISSSGEVPALSRLLREVLEAVLPEERWIAVARELRRKWRAEGAPMRSRFAELLAAYR